LHDNHLDISVAREKRDELQSKLVGIYAAAPRTTSKAYGIASNGLKNQEELTFSDEEIDKFLPAALRRTSSLPADK